MSAQTIGILGHNGLIGSQVLNQLYPLQQQGKLKLVVIHRPTSSTSGIPEDVEKRVLDWFAPDGAEFDQAVQGLDVILSAVGSTAVGDQAALLPALSRSKSLKAFVPSEFGASWSEEEIATMSAKFLGAKDAISHKARELGVPVTIVHAGIFSDFIFAFPIQWNVKENQVYVYGNSQNTHVPLTSTSYVAAALVKLLQQPIDSYVNKTFAVVEYSHTNKEITEIIGRLSGKAPQLVEYDEAMLEGQLNHENGYASLGAGILRKSGKGWYKYDDKEPLVVEGWKSVPVEEEIKKVLAPPA